MGMVKVKFIEDFTTKKKGQTGEYSNSLACSLVKRKVAVYSDEHLKVIKTLKENGDKRKTARKEHEAKLAADKKSRIEATIKAKNKLEKEGK